MVPPERWEAGDCMSSLGAWDEHNGRRRIGHFSHDHRLRGFVDLYTIDREQLAGMEERVRELYRLTNPVPSGQPR